MQIKEAYRRHEEEPVKIRLILLLSRIGQLNGQIHGPLEDFLEQIRKNVRRN